MSARTSSQPLAHTDAPRVVHCGRAVVLSDRLITAVRAALFAAAAPAVYAAFERQTRHAGYTPKLAAPLLPPDMRVYDPDPLLAPIGGEPLP